MTFTRATREFLDELRAVGRSRTTVAAYESDLGQLFGFIRPNSILAFTPAAITAYLAAGTDAGNTLSTRKRKKAACSSLGKFLVRRGYLHGNPVDLVQSIRVPRTPPRPFTEEECDALQALWPRLPARERLLMSLLFYTGLRVSPICNIRVGDVKKGSLRAVVKGGKVQEVQLHPDLQKQIEAYILEHTALDPTEYLLKKTGGGAMRPQRAEELTREWGKQAGVTKCTPHRFRHTVATTLLREGVDSRDVQKVMGHESLATTQGYMEVLGKHERAAVLKLPWTMARD